MERILNRHLFVCIWLAYALLSGANCSVRIAGNNGLSAAMAVQAGDLGATAAHASTALQPVCVTQSCWLGKGCITFTLLASVASFLLGRYTAHRRFRELVQGVLFRSAAGLLVKGSHITVSWSDTLLAVPDMLSCAGHAQLCQTCSAVPSMPVVEPMQQTVPASEGACQETATIDDYISTCCNHGGTAIQSTVTCIGSSVNTGSDDRAPDSTPFASSSDSSSSSKSSITGNSNGSSTNSGEHNSAMFGNLATGWTCFFSDTADSRGNSSSSNSGAAVAAAAATEPEVTTVDSDNSSSGSHISLGVLLGAGAFGKVYQGSWRGSPVAVKVITQLGSLAAQLCRREAELMLRAKHPNVVQTYHVVIWQRTSINGSRTCSGSDNSASNSSGRLEPGAPGAIIRSIGNNGAGSNSAESSGSTHADSACAAAGRQQCCGSIVGRPAAAAAAETAHCWPVGDAGGECELEFEFEGEHITRDGDLETQTWMVQELCDAGTLDIAAQNGKVDHPMAQVLCLLDISRGMQYLHSNHIMHGDLKCSNICLKKKHRALARLLSSCCSSADDDLDDHDAREFTCKVADFSLTRMVDAGKDHHSTKSLGTVTHLAPELLTNGRQTPACDVYSFGMLAWELLHKKSPFSGCLHEVEVLEKIVVQKERPAWSAQDLSNCQDQAGLTAGLLPDLIRLTEECWDQDPSKRPTFAQICNRLQQMQHDLSTAAAAARASALNRATRFDSVWPHGETGLQASVDRSMNVIAAAAGASSSSSPGNLTGISSEFTSSASQGMQARRSHSLGTGRRLSNDLETIPEQHPITNNNGALTASRSCWLQGRRSFNGVLSPTIATSTNSSGGRTAHDNAVHEGQTEGKHRTRRHGHLITDSTNSHLIIDAPLGKGYEAFARWLLGADGVVQLQEQQQQMKTHGSNHPVSTSNVTKNVMSHLTRVGKREAVSEGTGSRSVTWLRRASSDAAGKPAAPHSGYWE